MEDGKPIFSNDVTPSVSTKAQLTSKPKPERYPGFIYLVRRIDIGIYKIGFTERNVKIRLKEMRKVYRNKRKWDPFEIELLHVIECACAWCAEYQLQTGFNEKRVNEAGKPSVVPGYILPTDWFTLSDDDVTYIKSLEYLDICYYPPHHKRYA